jgi:sec-independent protein translocase protein TatA
MIQGPQLIIILAIVLILFGGSKLPKLARSLGQAQKEFRQGLSDSSTADQAGADAADSAAQVKQDGDETTTPSTD